MLNPGLTGLAQINGRNLVSWEKKFDYDLEYISNQSLLLDLKIIFYTIFKVLKRDGIMIHGCASSYWSFWTLITGVIKRWYLDPRSHSLISNNVFSEIINSRERFWKKYFHNNGLKTINVISAKLFYTGNYIFDSKISIKKRNKLSSILGSSTVFYILKEIRN